MFDILGPESVDQIFAKMDQDFSISNTAAARPLRVKKRLNEKEGQLNSPKRQIEIDDIENGHEIDSACLALNKIFD
jgi:hypothetical protein